VTPFCRKWDLPRGRAVDRHYIETFLERHRASIRGRVLEIGDAVYTRQFGSGVTRSDVLSFYDEAGVTLVADLEKGPPVIEAFDCIICTQTLQLLYDVRAAVRSLHAMLAPGGTLLATVPGISQIDDGKWMEAWCWGFTPASLKRLAGEAFGPERVETESFGNVLAAATFLFNLASDELDAPEIAHNDPAYPMVIALRASR
jgi:SAM-dependent methyltransferase